MATEEQVLICYRSACTNPATAIGYNRVTHGMYCVGCAQEIEEHNAAGISLFPLLRRYNEYDLAGGKYQAGIILVRPQ